MEVRPDDRTSSKDGKGVHMKLRILSAIYSLAALSALVLAAGAGRRC
jgi:hypothetical protein